MSKIEDNTIKPRKELKANEDVVMMISVDDLLTAWLKKRLPFES